MSAPLVSVVTIVRDELELLPAWLERTRAWADEIVLFDTGSTDGTRAWLRSLPSDPRLIIDLGQPEYIPLYGFASARNWALSLARGAYCHHLDVDEALHPDDVAPLRALLEPGRDRTPEVGKPIIAGDRWPAHSITTVTFNQGAFSTTSWEEIAATAPIAGQERHWRIHRRIPGMQFTGYMHEELHFGNEHVNPHYSGPSGLRHWHFTNYKPRVEAKEERYAWMLLRAEAAPYLQRGTHPWWYQTHVPAHRKALVEAAARFEERYPALVGIRGPRG